MAVDPAQPMHDERPARLPVAYPKNGGAPIGADPELLRWRAEVLLDEMMLGGVDAAAGEPLNHHAWPATATPSPATVAHENGWAPSANPSAPVAYENGHNGSNGVHYPTAGNGVEYDGRGMAPPEPLPRLPKEETPGAPDARTWVLSAEERYRQLARQQESGPAVSPPVEPTTTNNGEYVWPETTHPAATDPTTTMNSASVRRVANQFSGVAAAGAKRSNLLPRMSAVDVEVVQREIFTLKHEVDVKLPAGHDATKRAHHLLDKALAILQADPMRSAEVEYYLQQVRTIFQHVQQTIDWSTIYRKRLLIYQGAWILLTVLVVLACLLFQAQIENAFALYAGMDAGGRAIQQSVLIVAALFAGAMGGAISGLISLYHQGRLPHGFIDRKFGLRGLILPLIGAVIGGVFALLVGLIYTLVGINPASSLLASLLPMLLAFGFGVSQESIYGTRD